MTKMHGVNSVKFISAQQARKVYQYQNIKKKLLRTNASIWFNKICRHENLQPKYIDIKISGNNKRSHTTKQAAVKYRINLELKHLYKRKALLNKQLYETHLECANYWQESWYLIQRLEYQNSQHMNDLLYDKLNKDLISYDTHRHNIPRKTVTIRVIHQQIPNSIHVSKICPTYGSTKKKKVYYK